MTNFVTKRSGKKEPLDIAKWQAQIEKACEGISDVSQSMIEIKATPQFYDGMPTREIDEITLKAIVNLIDETISPDIGDTNYQFVAGRWLMGMLRKDVYGKYEPDRLYDIVKRGVSMGLYTKDLLDWYTKDEWEKLETFIDHSKDEAYPYAAVDSLKEKYLVKNRATKQIIESPQVRYMIAGATAFHAEAKASRLKWVKEFYNAASDALFTLATPVLAGLGTPTKQFSSCVLIRSNDTLDSIFASGEMMAKYASKRAGIGLEIGRMRPLGAPIRNGEIMHTGVVPFLKKWLGDLRSCSQGGIRNASCTVTYPIWHYQFEDLIVLKNNQGTEETRVRQLDYSVVVSNMFWNRFKKRENITFFDPNEVPDLYEAYYRDIKLFEKLYVKYEKQDGLKKKVLSADDVFKNGILKERTDTGRIYMVFIDNVQKQTPFDVKKYPIYQSNLCQEILLPTSTFERIEDESGQIALCTLGSMNWGAFRNPEDMKRAVRVLSRMLNNLLEYQDFLSVQSLKSNERFRPLGIGITNLAYWSAKRKLKYGTLDMLEEVKSWMEHQAYYATEASIDLAEERGPCEGYLDTCYGKGVFPWENRVDAVNELVDFTPELDWEILRPRMLKFGVRNAVTGAVAPVESSSVVISSTNGMEKPMALISTKESKSGSLVQVVPEYKKYKKHYELMWDDTDCIGYLMTAAVVNVYTDQSISTNTYYNPAHFPDKRVPASLIAGNLMKFARWGGKTVYYSLINKAGGKVEKDTEDTPLPEEQLEDADCEACKL